MATLAEVIESARELSFDKFVTPCLYITQVSAGLTIEITATNLKIRNSVDTVLIDVVFATATTLNLVYAALAAHPDKIGLSYAASYIGTAPSASLLPLAKSPLSIPRPLTRQYFFPDADVLKEVKKYFTMILGVRCPELDEMNLETEVSEFSCQRPEHMAMWMAYWLVERRRLYEMAGESLGKSTYSGTGGDTLLGSMDEDSDITVRVGSVFTLATDANKANNESPAPWAIGSDNVLGDATSFWYRIQLWLRSQLERLYGDYSLRVDSMMVGQIDLRNDQNFYAYFDSYPYTFSPLARGILSSWERR